jgi:hypothetical protein
MTQLHYECTKIKKYIKFALSVYNVSILHIISHSSHFCTLSFLCHHPLLHLSNSTHPVTLISVHCHSCAIIPYCISQTARILSLLLKCHHFPPSSAYCYTLKAEITNFLRKADTHLGSCGVSSSHQNHCTYSPF